MNLGESVWNFYSSGLGAHPILTSFIYFNHPIYNFVYAPINPARFFVWNSIWLTIIKED